MNLISVVLFLPIVGLLVLLFLPENNESQRSNIRWVAFGFSIVTFVASILLWLGFDPNISDYQFVQQLPIIDTGTLKISYYVGVDGISLLLVLLTTFIMPIAILSSFRAHVLHERGREKLYYIFMLLLEWAMIGVFVALDLAVFYVFWEVTLVPMYFLIGIWGA